MATLPMDAVRRSRLLPVLRCSSAWAAVSQAFRLADAGLEVVELTTTTPGWDEALSEVRVSRPALTLGLGTVTTAAQAEQAVEAGAEFLVSPYLVPPVARVAAEAGVPMVTGGFTPAELAAALAGGVAKLFPAHVGGPAYLRSVLAVMPGARIVPTGGIRLDEVAAWLEAGAYAVGVGADLTTDGDIEARVRKALDGGAGSGAGR